VLLLLVQARHPLRSCRSKIATGSDITCFLLRLTLQERLWWVHVERLWRVPTASHFLGAFCFLGTSTLALLLHRGRHLRIEFRGVVRRAHRPTQWWWSRKEILFILETNGSKRISLLLFGALVVVLAFGLIKTNQDFQGRSSKLVVFYVPVQTYQKCFNSCIQKLCPWEFELQL
jgi:hypothetical protein